MHSAQPQRDDARSHQEHDEVFQDLPDTAALSRLMGKDIGRPEGPPLFLDGLRAFPDERTWLPLPASHLDYASPWTAWRAAVNGSDK